MRDMGNHNALRRENLSEEELFFLRKKFHQFHSADAARKKQNNVKSYVFKHNDSSYLRTSFSDMYLPVFGTPIRE